jgi:hypothetical protein
MKEHIITTFVRTKSVFKHRLKDLKDYETVKVYIYELDQLTNERNHGPILWGLRNRGEIWYDDAGNFRALRRGTIDPSLLELTKKKDKPIVALTSLHLWMREQLRHVELFRVAAKHTPVYFRAFLGNREGDLAPFFSVDAFSGRVHSPVVNLKGDLRFKIRFHDKRIVSLDVKQMQPTILAKVLQDSLGENSFSTSIFKGEDVYVHLQRMANLPERRDAKKYLFQLIFGKPMGDIGRMFKGDTAWVDWINNYKSKVEPKNPHKENMHTNLAWLLQYSEVRVMTDIWNRLKEEGIPFLTIHDEILCKEGDEVAVKGIMGAELKQHFKYYEINVQTG